MKTILLLSILFAFAVTPASAQRSKRPASKARPAAKAPAKNKPAAANEPSAIEQAQHALSLYDVSTAREVLDKEMAVLTKKKQPTEAVEALMEQVQQIALKLHATEHIVIIDSVVCDKDKFLNAILLNREGPRCDGRP